MSLEPLPEPEKKTVFRSFSRRQWITFSVTAFMYFVTALVCSLQGPLYPPVADKKGVSATVFGAVFGLYGFVQLVISPVISSLTPRVGLKTTFNIAVVLAGGSTVAFGFLDRIDNYDFFVGASFVLRAIEAIGAAAVYVTAFSIVGSHFPGIVVPVIAALETLLGVGQALGPFVGSVLAELGEPNWGFALPFLAIGSLHFVSGFLTNWFVFREADPKEIQVGDPNSIEDEPISFIELIRVPGVLLFAFSVTVSGINNGLLYALLEPFLSQFNISKITVGTMFLIITGAYTLSAIFVGHLGNIMVQPAYLSIGGCVALGLAVWVLAPVPFIPIPPTLIGSALLFVVIGVAQSLIQITGFLMTLREGKRSLKVSEQVITPHASALFLSSYSMGFVGPIVGGAMYDYLGFPYTTLILGSIDLLLAVALICFVLARKAETNAEVVKMVHNSTEIVKPDVEQT